MINQILKKIQGESYIPTIGEVGTVYEFRSEMEWLELGGAKHVLIGGFSKQDPLVSRDEQLGKTLSDAEDFQIRLARPQLMKYLGHVQVTGKTNSGLQFLDLDRLPK